MAIVTGFLWLRPPLELKYRLGGEFVIYLLLGPMLLVGFAVAITSEVFVEDVVLGSIFGLSAMFLYQLKRFQYLMSESRSHVLTTFVRLGFDKSKSYLLILFVTLVLLTAGYQWLFHGVEWGVIYFILGLASVSIFGRKLKQTVSPLGRNIWQLQTIGRSLVYIFYSAWVLQATWYFVISGLFYAN